jgi:hypothetical protein
LRKNRGGWPGLVCERLIDSPLIFYPSAVRHWPPLQALHRFLLDELREARLDLDAARR